MVAFVCTMISDALLSGLTAHAEITRKKVMKSMAFLIRIFRSQKFKG